jgi:hypothetical protein
LGEPGEEETVGRDVFPVTDGVGFGLAAVAAEEFEEFFFVEPGLPWRGFQAAPVFGVLVDDDEAAAGFEDAAEFGDRAFDIDGVFERFGGVDGVERRGGEWEVVE